MKKQLNKRHFIAALLGCVLLITSIGLIAKDRLFILAGPIVKPIAYKATCTPDLWGPTQTPKSGVQSDSIHNFVVSQLNGIANNRTAMNQLRTKEEMRADLGVSLGIVKECLGGKSIVVSNTVLCETAEYELREIEISICQTPLVQFGLFAKPKAIKSPPLIIAIHGTASGPEVLFNEWLGKPESDYNTTDYHNNMGCALLRSGFAVFAPQLITERQNRPVVGFNERRNELHMRLLPLGYTLHGVELTMIMASINAIKAELDLDFDKQEIGAYGVSLGGATAFYLAALDDRIQATVVSQWVEDRDQKLMGAAKTANWRYPSGCYVYSRSYSRQFDDTELLKLVLPRGIFVEAGVLDGQRAESAVKLFEIWTDIFSEYVRDGRLCMEIADCGHIAVLNNSLWWLRSQLLGHNKDHAKCLPNFNKGKP